MKLSADARLLGSGTFRTFVTAIQTASLVRTLDGAGAYTVFAPTDRAFARIPAAELHALMADQGRLAEVIGSHLLPERLSASDLKGKGGVHPPVTLNGRPLQVEQREGRLFVNGLEVVRPDVEASNGVIHVLDGVLGWEQ
jgi:uncharacterized surface protein with fasciclin (FAS1) repeats